jgi:DNA polymerase-1
MSAELVGMSFSVKANKAVYIPFLHRDEGADGTQALAPGQLNRELVLKSLIPILQNKEKNIIGQNLKYDYKILKNHGVTIEAPMLDTMLESYVLNNTSARHDLDSLALKYLSKKTTTFEEIAGKGAKQITFDYVSIPVATQYAAEDADVALQIHHTLMPKIQQDPSCEKILKEIEWPLMPILAKMEYHGVLIDTQMLKKQSVELAERIATLENRTYELASEEFNLGSPKQLQTILFEKLKLPILKKTPTGSPSTDNYRN